MGRLSFYKYFIVANKGNLLYKINSMTLQNVIYKLHILSIRIFVYILT